MYNRYQLYEKGIDKYIKEFDAQYYAKSLRHLKMLVSSLMDDSERFMSVYQHYNCVSLIKSDTEDDSENEAIKDMPKLLHAKDDETKAHYRNISEFLENYYSETHSSKDFKLLKGAFTSKKLKNSEMVDLNPEKEDSYDDAVAPSEQDPGDLSIDSLGSQPPPL